MPGAVTPAIFAPAGAPSQPNLSAVRQDLEIPEMLALTTTGDDDLLRVTEVPDPEPGATEVLVRVETTSLNRGEVARAKSSPAGQQVGWDVCGIVERVAQGGVGPPAGTRVAGLVDNRAWAELVAVPVDYLTAVPEGVPPP